MGYKITFSAEKTFTKTKNKMKTRLEKYVKITKKKIDEKTPEKTKELLGNTQSSEIIEHRNKLYAKIFNDTPYIKYVEYGVGKVFNYQKPKGKIFYSGEGAGMFGRTINEIKGRFNELTK